MRGGFATGYALRESPLAIWACRISHFCNVTARATRHAVQALHQYVGTIGGQDGDGHVFSGHNCR